MGKTIQQEQPSKQVSIMMAKIFACLLLAISFQHIVADSCKCMNPWEGQRMNQHIGDPKNICPKYCYVSCDSDCSDKKAAINKGRCWSKMACPMTTTTTTTINPLPTTSTAGDSPCGKSTTSKPGDSPCGK